MHNINFIRTTTFTYQHLEEYPYLYAYTKTPPNKDINFTAVFEEFLKVFEAGNIDVYIKAMVGKNTVNCKFHTTKDRWHFHGIVASKIKFNLDREHFKAIYDLSGWLEYMNNNHNIGYVYKGFSL